MDVDVVWISLSGTVDDNTVWLSMTHIAPHTHKHTHTHTRIHSSTHELTLTHLHTHTYIQENTHPLTHNDEIIKYLQYANELSETF